MKLLEFFERDIQFLKGVGPQRAKRFKKAGIKTVEELLYFLPKDYQDRRSIKKIGSLKIGEKSVFIGKVEEARLAGEGRKIFEVVFKDETGAIKAKWFNFNAKAYQERFARGKAFLLFGEVRYNRFERCLEVIHPETRALELVNLEEYRRVVPVYTGIEGISNRTIERVLENAISELREIHREHIPPWILEETELPPLAEAFEIVHFARDELSRLRKRASKGHKRLIFEDFFPLQVALAFKNVGKKREKGISFNTKSELLKRFIERLPFSLTQGQKSALKEILKDMESPYPMRRLIQGDVGCGKTVVAVAAALVAIDNGYQVAFMAPTEILAEQHYRSVRELVKGMGINLFLLTASTPKGEKERIYSILRSSGAHLVVGTHALIQEKVEFKRLGFVVIDEQHRFGVIQRKTLKEKGENPDLLVMTATPIPRTLALTVYGDLDISVIKEMPKGRKPIITRMIYPEDREKAYSFIETQIRKGRQAYIVFPLIEESEKLRLPSVLEMYPVIAERFRSFRVGLLHGRMKGEEKEKIMRSFKEGKIHILVCTTVIEVGIDVPNATVIMIEGAERFGLSQLHQLRGRVGRGKHRSYCLLMVSDRKNLTQTAYRRLKVMEKTTDGFKIAEEDLALRGPGELFGTRQSGLPEFKVADILRDAQMLSTAREYAFRLIEQDPLLMKAENRLLRELLFEKGLMEKASLTESG